MGTFPLRRACTDADGHMWVLVRPAQDYYMSDGEIGLILAILTLVPGLALMGARLIWGVPDLDCRPGRRSLILFGFIALMTYLLEEGRGAPGAPDPYRASGLAR